MRVGVRGALSTPLHLQKLLPARSMFQVKWGMIAPLLSLLIANGGAFPVGSYTADVSRAPSKSRGVLQAYFGQTRLRINRTGKFVLCGIEQEGYWRQDGNRYVLMYTGFFNVQFGQPEVALRRAWPKSHLEGMILRRGPGGTLVLKDWGAVSGPVIFRPMPRRSVPELIIATSSDTMDAKWNEAWESLHDERPTVWTDMLRFVDDPKQADRQRSWAAIMLEGLAEPRAIEEAARLILNLRSTQTAKNSGLIRLTLARAVCRHPSAAAADVLLEANRRGLLRPADVARALGNLKRPQDVPLLVSWLDSKRAYDRIYSLNALAEFGGQEGLEKARGLTLDAAENVQLAAYGLIARASADPAERKAAVVKLAGWIKSSDLLLPFAAVDALCRSQAPEALPYLVAILGSDMRAMNRRNTAMALGELGDPRAVPALIEAKTRTGGNGSMVEESEVRRAAAEALVKIGRRKG